MKKKIKPVLPPVTTPAEARARYGYAPGFLASLEVIAAETRKTFADVILVARAHNERIGDMSFLTSEMIMWNRAALGLATEAEAHALTDKAERAATFATYN